MREVLIVVLRLVLTGADGERAEDAAEAAHLVLGDRVHCRVLAACFIRVVGKIGFDINDAQYLGSES